MEETIPLNLKIDRQLKDQLVETAEREGRTMTVIVERALAAYFAKSRLEAQRGEAQPETRPA